MLPLDASASATDCIICDRATEYDHDGLAHSGCIATHDKCHQSFQLIVTNETRPNICEECAAEHYQDLSNTTEQCKPWTVCDINSTEVQLVTPSLAVNRVCGCAEDHYLLVGEVEKVGSEFSPSGTSGQAGEFTTTDLSNGGFAVAFTKNNVISIRLYDEFGVALQNQQTGIKSGASVGDGSLLELPNGKIVVSYHNNLQDGNNYDVYARIYNPQDDTVGVEFDITNKEGSKLEPQLLSLNNGFAVLYKENNVNAYLSKFDIEGNKIGEEVSVSDDGSFSLNNARATNLNDGSIVVLFYRFGDGSSESLFLQRFDKDGNKIGDNVNLQHEQLYAHDVSSLPTGEFMVVTQKHANNIYHVYGQVFDANGIAGDLVLINNRTNPLHKRPKVIGVNNGFVVLWEEFVSNDLGFNLYLQQFDKEGNKVNNEVLTKEEFDHNMGDKAISPYSKGFIAVWAVNNIMKAQRYTIQENICSACAAGTRLAGDEKMDASQCCVDAYQSAVGATCTAYTEDEASCNALRRPLIEGTEAVDAACGALCDEATQFAEDSACLPFLTTCGPGLFLTGGSNDTQKTCDACPTETFKATNGSEACAACAAGSEVSEDRTACTPCNNETHYDDDQNSSTVCAPAVSGCDEGTQFVVTDRTTDNRCDACPAGQFQELNASTVQCGDYTTNATYCNSLNKRFVEGKGIRDSHCFESECLAGEEAIGTKCLCIENYHLVNGVCSACSDGLFRIEGDDKLEDLNTNCTPSGCFVLPNYTSVEFATGQGDCVDSIAHEQSCKLECAAGHHSYAYSCEKGILTDPVVACSKCPRYQHSVDGVCTDDTAYLACNCTSAACPESGDTYFSIGRHDRDDSECRQPTWVEEQIGQEVERPTTDYEIKQVFQNMAAVFEAPVQAGNTTQTASKEEQREQFQSIIQYVKDEIEAMPNRRIEIPKEVMVLSDEFLQGLGDREKVELVIPKTKTPAKIQDPASACEEKDVDLAAQEAAYDVSLGEGDISLLCRGDDPVTKLEKLTDGFEYACFENGAWLGTESIDHDGSYECAGKKFYVNSHSGLTCPVTRPVSVVNELIVTGTNLDCGLTLAEGETCQTECNPNYEKVSEANCTAEGFQPATCKCDKEGFSEDHFGNCKECDIGSFSAGAGQACLPWTVGAEDCNAIRKVFQAGNATMDAQCGETCPEGLVAEWDHCTDPDKKVHCDTLSWFYFSGACCDSFDNSPTCLHQVDRKAVPVMQSLSYVKRADRTECQEGDKIVFHDGGMVCQA